MEKTHPRYWYIENIPSTSSSVLVRERNKRRVIWISGGMGTLKRQKLQHLIN